MQGLSWCLSRYIDLDDVAKNWNVPICCLGFQILPHLYFSTITGRIFLLYGWDFLTDWLLQHVVSYEGQRCDSSWDVVQAGRLILGETGRVRNLSWKRKKEINFDFSIIKGKKKRKLANQEYSYWEILKFGKLFFLKCNTLVETS